MPETTGDPFVRVELSTNHVCALSSHGGLTCRRLDENGTTPSVVAHNVSDFDVSDTMWCVVQQGGELSCEDLRPGFFRDMGIAPGARLHLRDGACLSP